MKKAGGPLGGFFVQAMSGQRSGLNIQRNELSDVFYVRSLVFIELHVQPKTVGLMFTIIIISLCFFVFWWLLLLLVVGVVVETPGGDPDRWVIFQSAAVTFFRQQRCAHAKYKKKTKNTFTHLKTTAYHG